MPPLFIVIEGPDGSGTTKHAELLAERLQKEGNAVFLTAEPSNGPIGTEVRKMLSDTKVPNDALQLLFTADRADHVGRQIVPALERGDIVVCDRYAVSTIAYGEALGLDEHWLMDMNAPFPPPTLMFFALPPYEVCQGRLSRRDTKDRMETDELQRKVYENYRRLAEEHPTIEVIDTSGSKEEVHEKIWTMVKNFLPH